jgi:hypothetical protein
MVRRYAVDRRIKLIRIGQAHLAPGMSLEKWREILEWYGALGRPWETVEDAALDAIIEAVVESNEELKMARRRSGPELT